MGKSSSVPIKWEAEWSQNQSGMDFLGKKNLTFLLEIELLIILPTA
jgi:hypothetical protein